MIETLHTSINSILQGVILVVIPLAAIFAGKLVKDWINVRAFNAKNEYVRDMFIDIADTLEAAVNSTAQTYVDELKDKDIFDLDAQAVAFKKSFDNTKKLLNDEAKELIIKTHGDLDLWLTTQIESFIRTHGVKVPFELALPTPSIDS